MQDIYCFFSLSRHMMYGLVAYTSEYVLKLAEGPPGILRKLSCADQNVY